MGPSCRRSTRIKSSSRRKPLSKKHRQNSSKSKEKSAVVIPAPVKPSDKSSIAIDGVQNLEISYSDDVCSTPKAEKYRIPEIKTCPLAPMKRRRATNFALKRSTAVPIYDHPDIELFFYFALRGVSV